MLVSCLSLIVLMKIPSVWLGQSLHVHEVCLWVIQSWKKYLWLKYQGKVTVGCLNTLCKRERQQRIARCRPEEEGDHIPIKHNFREKCCCQKFTGTCEAPERNKNDCFKREAKGKTKMMTVPLKKRCVYPHFASYNRLGVHSHPADWVRHSFHLLTLLAKVINFILVSEPHTQIWRQSWWMPVNLDQYIQPSSLLPQEKLSSIYFYMLCMALVLLPR